MPDIGLSPQLPQILSVISQLDVSEVHFPKQLPHRRLVEEEKMRFVDPLELMVTTGHLNECRSARIHEPEYIAQERDRS